MKNKKESAEKIRVNFQKNNEIFRDVFLGKKFQAISTLTIFVVLVGLEAISYIGFVIFEAGGWMKVEFYNIPPIWSILISVNIIASLVLALVFGRIVFLPIKKLNKAMEEVTNGNFEVRLNIKKHGELGTLVKNFDNMVTRLKSIETLKTDFITDVSHEFKNPLASIQGYMELLKRGDISETEKNECFEIIENNIKRLSVLSSNVLTLSKLNNESAPYKKAEYDLSEQLRRVVVALSGEWQKKNVDIELDLSDIQIYGVEELNWQVWYNLIQNAIKFSDPGGKIKVEASENEGVAEIIISDEGIGMSDEVRKNIFHKFYQGDPSRSKDGNGLGLAIVYRIIDAVNGAITVESAPNEGSTFTVFLPMI